MTMYKNSVKPTGYAELPLLQHMKVGDLFMSTGNDEQCWIVIEDNERLMYVGLHDGTVYRHLDGDMRVRPVTGVHIRKD